MTYEPNADADIDLNAHKVTMQSKSSVEALEQLIVASGHKVS